MTQRYIGGLIYNPPGGWSGQFGATSTDMLSTTSSAAFAFGTGDFTMEAFVFATASQTDNWIIGLASNCWLRIGASGVLEFYNGVASSSIAAASAMPLNQWIHVAAVRSGTTLTIYQNGVSIASGTVSTNFSTSVACTVGNQSGYDRRWNGYISNVRVVKGTAVYTTAFTPPNGPLQNITNTSLLTCRYPTFVDGSNNAFTLTVSSSASVSTQNPFPLTTLPNPAQGGAGNGIFSMSQYQSLKQQNLWPAIDPYFDYTTLLLHGNGTNGGQNNTFQDSSTNNFTITRNGNTTQGTFSPFSQTGWSNYFDGSGDYLQAGTSSNLALGSGDFTVEGWHFCTGYNGGGALYSTINTYPSSTGFLFYIYSDGSYTIDVNGTILKTTAVAALNTWVHYAVVRSGSTITIYANGTSVGTVSNSTNFTDQYAVIGRTGAGSASNYYLGYLSNCRTVKGTAVYTSAFTPPTAPLTAITNTQFLTCQSNRFIDNSANQFTITVNGNTSVQAFSPFAPTAAYSASTVGGSGYFDGTGDYLSVPDNAAFDFGTGEFTIECWVYFNNISGDQYVLSYDAGTTPDHIGINIYSGAWRIGGFNSYLITGSTGLIAQQWIHVVMTRQSNTLRAYINGVQLGTSDVTGISFNANNTLYIGGEFSSGGVSFNLNGYISGMRIVKDGNLYPNGTTFTPPTTPPTTTVSSGTVSLLCNFTNAAIIDNTAKNVLETVGNAQISTSVSKFGGASIYLDGNDNCVIPNSENFNFRNGNFTIEFWYYPSTLTVANAHILDFGDGLTGGQNGWNVGFFGASNTNTLGVIWTYDGSSENKIQDSVALTTGSWVFVTVVRSGTSLVLYKNGISVASATLSGAIATSNRPLVIGSNQSLTSGYVNGYIDDLRITKGIARYTSNFTPQTSQWQDQ